MPPKAKPVGMEILKLDTTTIEVCIVGKQPLLLSAMSQKAKQELMAPSPKKKRVVLEASQKHDPLKEYQSAVYRARDSKSPTTIVFPPGGIKAAIANAALRVPGATKTEIGQLTWIEGQEIPIFGIPQMHMSIVRMANQARTPDVRTRCVLPEWAARFQISFVEPNLTGQGVMNLLAAAGLVSGLGEWRPQKGSGNYGQFTMVSPSDSKFKRIVKAGGKTAQNKGLKNPTYFDSETEELATWHAEEMKRRGKK